MGNDMSTNTGKKNKTCVLVLGMHRSGTSALSRLMSIAGCKLPANLMSAGTGNELGHWESEAIVRYSDAILEELDSDWMDWRALNIDLLDDSRRSEIIRKYRQLLEQDYGEAPLIVVKDPRICRFMPLFLETLHTAGYEVRVVFIVRNPLEVAESLMKRQEYWLPDLSETDGALLWLRYVLEAEEHSRHLKRLVITYEDLLEDWEKIYLSIAETLGLDALYSVSEIASQVGNFLSEKHRHHYHPTEEVIHDPALRDWVGQAYEALLILARNNESTKAVGQLDVVTAEFNRASPIIHKILIAAKDRAGEEVYFLKGELRNREKKGTELMTRLQDLEAERTDLLERVQDAEEERTALTARLQDAEEERTVLTARIGFAEEEKAALMERLQDAGIELEDIKQRLADSEGHLRDCVAKLNKSNNEVSNLKQLGLVEAGKLQNALRELAGREDQIARLETELSGVREELLYSNDALAKRGTEVSGLMHQLGEAENRTKSVAQCYKNSLSWRLTAPARSLGKLFLGRKQDVVQKDSVVPAPANVSIVTVSSKPLVFFTICSRNFLAYAHTLYQSLIRFHPDSEFYVALCDDSSLPFDSSVEPFPFVYLDDLDLPDWREMSRRYNITEFNTSIKPFVIKHLFEKKGAEKVIYLDPDIYVVNRFTEIEESFAQGVSAIVTPHMLEPAESAEMNEKRLLQYGIYNLGFLALKNTSQVRGIVEWWGRRLITDCVIEREEGLFVDQKWADHFPAFIHGCRVLHHPGYNVAYWNLSSRKVTWNGELWSVNDQPLRFVHFSGHTLEDHSILSRHSSEHTPSSIGDLRLLLEEFRKHVISNNHAHYSKIPYAFNWDGVKGVNEHTPRPEHQAAGQSSTFNYSPGRLFQISNAVSRAYQQGGVKEVKAQLIQAGKRAYHSKKRIKQGTIEIQDAANLQPWRKTVLFVDWSTPTPDRDSGSRTNFYLIKILTLLGYRVAFIPGDLEHAGRYTEALEEFGVSCIDYRHVDSVEQYLVEKGEKFDFVYLSRGPVATAYVKSVVKYCINAKRVFNTVDLHYLRELREADIADSKSALAAALQTKKDELELVGNSHATIVLSQYEKDELEREMPDRNVRLLPLIFAEVDSKPPGFIARKDILFIGSFPHLPNIDAVLFFGKEVFPRLQAVRSDIMWHIVGTQPPENVQALGNHSNIVVHGFVEDLAPLFRSIRLTVAPLRYGAGIKGKIATSLSYGVPVIASQIAVEGMSVESGRHVLVADEPEEYVKAILELYDDEKRWNTMSELGQEQVINKYSLQANTLCVADLMRDLDDTFIDIDLFEFSSQRDFELTKKAFFERLKKRSKTELELIPLDKKPFNISGFCAVCGGPSKFRTGFLYSSQRTQDGRAVPNWREHLACQSCGFTMRLRAAMHIFYSHVCHDPSADIYLTEQTTPLYRWLKSRHLNLTGSEYLGDAVPYGSERDGLRNEDLIRLTFPDMSFDYIISFDVMEHVTDDLAAFRECLRCLKPGGVLFFTAPFSWDKANKVVRAEKNQDGEIEHYLEPEFHGNPVDPDGGALCFRYFAWDVLNDLREAGFSAVKVMNYWSREYAYLGPSGFIVVGKK
jgi:glycosyltransferase involved in cell wall biosynthesis